MPRKPKDPIRSAAQLRVMMRYHRRDAWISFGLALFSGLGVTACWRFHAHGFLWFLSITGVVAALIQIADRVTVYYDTKKRVAEIERELETHAA